MKILHAIHDFLPRHRAGSEIYAYELCRQLSSEGHEVTVLCAEYDPSRPQASISRREHGGLPVVEIVNNWAFRSFEESYASPRIHAVLDELLKSLAPDLLHIHSLLNLSLELPRLARARGIPSVATLHDYTLVCPSGGQRLHLAEQHLCETIDTERCSRCFRQSPFHAQMACHPAATLAGTAAPLLGLVDKLRRRTPRLFGRLQRWAEAPMPALTAADVDRRLDVVRQSFEHVELFVAPSASLASEYLSFGLPAAKLVVSDYGFVPFDALPRVARQGLRIGFVGTLAWHKGAHVLLEAVAKLRPGDFEVLVYGDPAVFPAYAQELEAAAQGLPLRFLGAFDETRIAEVYGSIDVLVVPSLWPENSPLVIHEAFLAGVPVVGARRGGIPDLVQDGIHGLLYDAESSDALAAALQKLIDEPGLLQAFASALPAVKTIAEDAAQWQAVYQRIRAGRRAARAASA